MTTVVIAPATADDSRPIADLLARNALPLDGLEPMLAHAVVARDAGEVVGCAGLEVYGASALLRSVAVDPGCQGRGLGQRLTESALQLARERGVTEVFLLTTTAEGFFPRFGFARISREQVPEVVRQSVEFVSACPASAIVMRAEL